MKTVDLEYNGTITAFEKEHAKRILQHQVLHNIPEFNCWKLVDEKWVFEDNKLKYVTKPDKATDKKTTESDSD